MPEEMSTKSALSIPVRRSRGVESYSGPTPAAAAHQRSVGLVLWQRKLLVLLSTLLALGCGILFLSRATPLYSSSSTLYVQQSMPKIVSEDLGGGSSMGSVSLATQCELITSSAILGRAAKDPLMAGATVMARQENAVGFLKSVVKAEPSKQGEMLVISVTSPNANDNAVIVNAVVQAYIGYETEQHQSSAVQVAGILQKEVDSHEAELKDAQAKLLALRLGNPQLLTQFDKRDESVSLQSQLAKQLSEAQLRANGLHAAVRSADAAQGNLGRLRQLIDLYNLGGLLPPSQTPRVSAEYRQDVDELRRLSGHHLGSANDAVQVAQAEVDRLQAELGEAARQDLADCLDTIRVASAAADDQAQQLRTSFEVEQKSTLGLNAKAAEYDQLAASAQRNEHEIEVLDGRLKDIDFTKDVGPMTVEVLETAKPSRSPVSPVKTTILGESLVVGLMAGVAAALLADRMDQRLRSIEEIPGLLDTPILGVIPRVIRRGMRESVGRETFLLPRSATAEAFRTVRTAIYLGVGSANEESVKTILVTSPTPGDGKSTCVSNLAIAVAQAGRRVLLIDADCRRPVQHKVFSVADSLGLTGVLSHKTTLTEAIRSTDVDRLDVLPCGPLPHNPAELLDSQIMLDVLAEAGRRYDQVLIDSPPVNLVSDARILAASCDASVLVVRMEVSTRRAATMAWNLLGSVGASCLGVMVNDVTRRTDGYYGYNYYGYGPYHSPEPVINGNGVAEIPNGRLTTSSKGRHPSLAAAGDASTTPEV